MYKISDTRDRDFMSCRVTMCVDLWRTVAFASGGLGSAVAWFIDHPVVSAATLTVVTKAWRSANDGLLVNVQQAGRRYVGAVRGALKLTRDSHKISC